MRSPACSGTTRQRVPVHRRDLGEIVTGWLLRLTLTLAVLGVLAFDGIAYGVATITVHDAAAAGARAAADDYLTFRDVERAHGMAVAEVGEGAAIPRETFTVDETGTVSLTARRSARCLVLRFLPQSESWLAVEATASAAPR